jgi:hypothetical protein
MALELSNFHRVMRIRFGEFQISFLDPGDRDDECIASLNKWHTKKEPESEP